MYHFVEPTVIAKSSIVLDVKPWDDETDMAKVEECVRSVEADGLLWGACKFLIAFCDLISDSAADQVLLR